LIADLGFLFFVISLLTEIGTMKDNNFAIHSNINFVIDELQSK
jgi:hypothetical protein